MQEGDIGSRDIPRDGVGDCLPTRSRLHSKSRGAQGGGIHTRV